MLICIVKGATDVISLADNETFLNCIQWAFTVLQFQSHYNVFIGCFVLELNRDHRKECLWAMSAYRLVKAPKGPMVLENLLNLSLTLNR